MSATVKELSAECQDFDARGRPCWEQHPAERNFPVTFDTVIRNGRWFDGTGAPSAIRNIGIRDGRVAAISAEPLDETGLRQVIDAAGKWVMPGLLDIHTHYDVEVLGSPGAVGVGAARRDHGAAGLVLAVDDPRRRPRRRRPVRAGGGHPARARDRARSTSHKTWTQLRGVHRRAGGAAARPERDRVHRPFGHARRDHGPGPRHPQDVRPTAAELARMEPMLDEALEPASSECPRSNCFSTSSTARSAGRAPCRRPTRSRGNCAG